MGGGATLYHKPQDLEIWGGLGYLSSTGIVEDTFMYEMDATDKIQGFLRLSVQSPLGNRFLVGLNYIRHFGPAVNGTYNFYHTPAPLNGNLSVTQESVGFLVLFRIGKPIPK